jgi:hypothetical protein
LRHHETGDHVERCLRRDAAAEAGRLLRVPFPGLGSMPADPGRGRFLLSRIAFMANNIAQRSHDWLQSPQTNLLAWWIPWIAVIAGLFAPVAFERLFGSLR